MLRSFGVRTAGRASLSVSVPAFPRGWPAPKDLKPDFRRHTEPRALRLKNLRDLRGGQFSEGVGTELEHRHHEAPSQPRAQLMIGQAAEHFVRPRESVDHPRTSSASGSNTNE